MATVFCFFTFYALELLHLNYATLGLHLPALDVPQRRAACYHSNSCGICDHIRLLVGEAKRNERCGETISTISISSVGSHCSPTRRNERPPGALHEISGQAWLHNFV